MPQAHARRVRRRHLRDAEWSIPETALLQRFVDDGLLLGEAAAQLNVTRESAVRRLREINRLALEAADFFKQLASPKKLVYRGPAKITLPRIAALERRPSWYFSEAS